jgi:TPR repeat protein
MRLWPAILLTFALLAVSPAQKSGSINAAQYYERGMNALLGTGVSRSDQTALQLLKSSAELGHLPAQTVVGYFYDTGTLVASEPGQAADWYRKAANQGDPLGAWLLGRLYYTGSGVGRDLSRAEPLFQNAAGQGDVFGRYFLGLVKLDRQEYAKAAASFRQAAEQGLPQAQFQLGELLKDGKGVGQDKFEAYVWLLVSLNGGNQAASSDVAFLEGDLGSTQVEKAKSRARELETSASRSVAAHGCTGWPGEFDAVPGPPPPDLQRFCR